MTISFVIRGITLAKDARPTFPKLKSIFKINSITQTGT